MITKAHLTTAGAVALIVGWTVTIEGRFEKQAVASETHSAIAAQLAQARELLAAEQEAARLENELKVIDLELKFLRSLQRALSSEEADRLEYLRARRMLIEARLLESVKTG